jgi:hypothetical protein
MPQQQPYDGAAIETMPDALEAFQKAWPPFVAECRSVLGSELHYQALLYHCLRAHGQVPSGQLGMNVKMRIMDPVSDLFQDLDEKKHPDYRGGFEPIPDVVIFRHDIHGDWRRRNRDKTVKRALMAVEVKVSDGRRSDLVPKRSWTTSSSSRRCGPKLFTEAARKCSPRSSWWTPRRRRTNG